MSEPGKHSELKPEPGLPPGLYVSSFDRTKIWVHTWECGSEDILLCIHGLAGHGLYYDRIAAEFNQLKVSVYAIDLRGHGRSQGKRGDIPHFGYHIKDIHRVVSEITRRFPNKKVHVLGESMGSTIAILYAAANKEKVRSLILLSPVLKPILHHEWGQFLQFIFAMIFMPFARVILLAGRENLATRDPEFFRILREDPLYITHASVRYMLALRYSMWRAFNKADLIRIPTLILHGTRDLITDHRASYDFFYRLSSQDKRIDVFSRVYHSMLFDPKAPLVVRKMVEWVKAR